MMLTIAYQILIIICGVLFHDTSVDSFHFFMKKLQKYHDDV